MTQIQISFNNRLIACPASTSVNEFLALKNIDGEGTAIARNSVIVTKSQWSATYLSDGDKLDIFTLVAGG